MTFCLVVKDLVLDPKREIDAVMKKLIENINKHFRAPAKFKTDLLIFS